MLKSCRDPEAAGALLVLGAAALSLLAGLALGELTVPAAAWPLVATTGVIEGVYFVTLGRALQWLPLGSAYGISRGVGLLVLWPASVLWFGEAVDLASASGAVLLSLGLLVLIAGVPSRLGLAYAVGCALSISAYPLAYKRALLAGVAPFALFGLSLSLALPLQVVGLGSQRKQRLATAWQAHRPALVHQRPVDRLPYPPCGVGRKSKAPLRLELVDGVHQAQVAFFDQIGHGTGVVFECEKHQRTAVPAFRPMRAQHDGAVEQFNRQCGIIGHQCAIGPRHQ